MPDRVSRWMPVPLACGLALALWCCRPQLVAQEKKAPAGDEGKALAKMYFGVEGCTQSGCHAEMKPLVEKQPLLCRCTEATIWTESDKHADAYKVLLGRRGQQMLKILGIKQAKDAKACLTCHAAVVENEKERSDSFKVEEGVSCVVCHGAYEPWVGAHSLALSRRKFRVLSRERKAREYGMTDLWDPIRRSQLCASCHVGNAAEGKVVTHDMYAAGHPPLPGFEIASFSDLMPRHWQYLSEKPEPVQQIYGYDAKKQEHERAKMVLVGAAVSLAEYMRLVEADARQARDAAEDDKKVLDWASFDCWSCHHDLKSPSWRQQRGYAGKPGRVPMKSWPGELIPLALDHLGEKHAEFDQKWKAVQAAFVAKQFGDPKKVAETAGDLAGWADKLAKRLNDSAVDAAAAKKLLAKLVTLPTDRADYDSARQVGWAYRAIWKEQAREKGDPEALRSLDIDLRLTFPTGRMKGKEGVIVEGLEEGYKRLYDYDPGRVLKLFRGLAPEGR